MDKSLAAVNAMVSATLAVGAIVLLQFGADNEGLRQALRATARFSLVLFALAYLASPLHHLRPSRLSRWMMTNRSIIGICFWLSIAVHIVPIFWLFANHSWAVPNGIGPANFLIGALSLIIVVAMTITSARALKRMMSPRAWRHCTKAGCILSCSSTQRA